jgi:uncharacterized NAD(P)/FAD-binding protein YdhS
MSQWINKGGSVLHVAVIGGGAAGTLSAVHLMRAAGEAGVEVVLIDRDGDFGPGVAYRTRDPLHVLNVPAIRMGGISTEPEHFHGWLRERGHGVAPEAFVPRHLFGDYLRDLLDQTEAESGPAVRLRRVTGEAVGIRERAGRQGGLTVELADGNRAPVDRAVLAIGPLPATDPVPVAEELRANGVYVSDPWMPGALAAAGEGETVLAIGTGLTMVDVALSLERGGRGPAIRAISRHGLVPRRHRPELTRLLPFPVPADGGLEAALATLLEQVAAAGRDGGDWRDAFDSMRPVTPAIWRSLDTADKRRFLAGLQRLWDVHRFRMAPEVADRFEALRAAGRLAVGTGSILAVEPSARGAQVTVRESGTGVAVTIDVDRIVNCTGAGADITRQAPPLLVQLIADGIARPDELSFGLDVEESGAVRDADGRTSSRVHVVGCLRRGAEWEAIGVTEIRDHAAEVAGRALSAPTAPCAPVLGEPAAIGPI